MPGDASASNLSPGTEDNQDHHYLVFSPAIPPGRETDTLAKAFREFLAGGRMYVDLILRISDPQQLHRDQSILYEMKVRVYPTHNTVVQVATDRYRFAGSAFLLQDGEEQGPPRTCTADIRIGNHAPDSPIGELNLSSTTEESLC